MLGTAPTHRGADLVVKHDADVVDKGTGANCDSNQQRHHRGIKPGAALDAAWNAVQCQPPPQPNNERASETRHGSNDHCATPAYAVADNNVKTDSRRAWNDSG